MQQQELTEQQQRRKQSSISSLQKLDQTKLKLSKLFVRSQDLDLKKLKMQLTVHQRLSKSRLTRLQLMMLRLNLRLREQKLLLSNQTSIKIKGFSYGSPFLCFISDILIVHTFLHFLEKIYKFQKKPLQLKLNCCIVYVALLWCSRHFSAIFSRCPIQ